MSDKALLEYGGNKYEFPLVKGTEDELGIDIKTLRGSSNLITLDPGFKNTGSCESGITYLDGEKGILRYRGYAIEDSVNCPTGQPWTSSMKISNKSRWSMRR